MVNGYGRTYAEQGRIYLTQAYEELERGDFHHAAHFASEKGWEAGEQAIKAYASARGLPHSSMGHLLAASSQLGSETGDDTYRLLFNQVLALHTNSTFYESGFGAAEIRRILDHVAEFVGKIEGLLNGRNGVPTT